MTEFDKIKDIWNKNKPIPKQSKLISISNSKKYISNKHKITFSILLITLIVTGYFFINLVNLEFISSYIGIAFFELAIFFRIIIEVISYRKNNNLNTLLSPKDYISKLCIFQTWRKKAQGIYSIIPVSISIVGVLLIFYEFKFSLPSFWFNFFFIEFIIIAIILSVIIVFYVKKELRIINETIENYKQNINDIVM